MRSLALLGLLILLLNVSVFAQDDAEAPAADGAGEGENKEGGEEECEEAWDYVEFMKANLK